MDNWQFAAMLEKLSGFVTRYLRVMGWAFIPLGAFWLFVGEVPHGLFDLALGLTILVWIKKDTSP